MKFQGTEDKQAMSLFEKKRWLRKKKKGETSLSLV